MKRHPFLTFFGALTLLILGICFIASRGPDFDVEFERRVPSTHTVAEIGSAIDDLRLWPVYYHGLKEVKLGETTVSNVTDPKINPRLKSGDVIELKIEQPQKEWKRFSLTTKVSNYEPGKTVAFELMTDSKGKLSKMFNGVAWDIRVEPMRETETGAKNPKGYQAWIIGTAKARTTNWRGRLFGRISPKILMNQIYVIDLVKLGTLERQVAAKKDNLAPSYQ